MAEFAPALAYTGINEGGYQANPNDPGNWYQGELLGTNWGISAPVARQNGWTGRMQDMPQSFANSIYENQYWPGLGGIENQAIATKIFDMRVNWGNGGGDRIAQKALVDLGWPVAVDGQIGPESLSAINQTDPTSLMQALCDEVESAYRADVAAHPSKAGFLDGWIARARSIPPGLVIAGGIGIAGLVVAGMLFWAAVNA